MKTPRASLVIASLLVSVSAVPAFGASFRVLRASDAGAIVDAVPIATVTTSPFDDSATRLLDDANYFYAVLDEGGGALTIAAQRNDVQGGVRVSFDDGNPFGAPVSPEDSTVTVAPASIRADGVQIALATIRPRDAQGVSLGRGLAVVVDAGLLWPGHLVGPVEDMGDGTYCARISSTVPGDGVLDVTVEGTALSTTPSVSFVTPDPGGSLRDLAILRLRDLTSAGGRFAALRVRVSAHGWEAQNADRAWSEAAAALGELEAGDLWRDDNALKHNLDAALRQLLPLIETSDSGDVSDLMSDLLDIARLIAAYHLERAESACGVCHDGSPRKVCDAVSAMAEADAGRVAVSPDWSGVIDGYARSVQWSIQAEYRC